MDNHTKSWWQTPVKHWNRGDAGRLVKVLSRMYGTPEAVHKIAFDLGIDHPDARIGVSAKELWVPVLNLASQTGKLLDIAAEALHDPETKGLHRPLMTLLGDQLSEANARLVYRYGASQVQVGATGDPNDLVGSLTTGLAVEGDTTNGALQGIRAAPSQLEDPHAFIQAWVDSTRRIAMIEIGGHPEGTGFLVAPSIVLTAAHVIDPHKWPPPRESKSVTARFSYFRQPKKSKEDTGETVRVVQFLAGSLPTASEVAGAADQDWNAPEDRLDFALLRLEHAPQPDNTWGHDGARGSYRLHLDDYEFGPKTKLFIMQHPLGQFQAQAWVESIPEPNALGTRLRYASTTQPGSSGSPIITENGRLVGIHQYQGRDRHQGIPISSIAKFLDRCGYADLLAADPESTVTTSGSSETLDPFRAKFLKVGPFVNRDNFRQRLRCMAHDEDTSSHVMAITGVKGSGVSYSYYLAAHVAGRSKGCESLLSVAPQGLRTTKIDLSSYVSLGAADRQARLIEDILAEFELHLSPEPLAQDARTTNRMGINIRSVLRDSPHQWWIFFDSVDNIVVLKDSGIDEVIRALITIAEDEQYPLRVVLAGEVAEAFASEHALSWESDYATGLVRDDVELWLRERAEEENRRILDDRLRQETAAIFKSATLPEPRAIAVRLPRILFDVSEVNHDES